MIWLLIPHTGKINAWSESSYLALLDMAKFFIKHGDLAYMIVPAPSIARGRLEKVEGLEYVGVPLIRDFYANLGAVDIQTMSMFSQETGRLPVDVVLTAKAAAAPALRLVLGGLIRDIPIFCWEPAMLDKLARIEGQWNETGLRALAYGYAESTPVFLTQNEARLALELLEKYMSPAIVKAVRDRMIVASVGVNTDKMDALLGMKKAEVPTVLYGGRVNEVKQVRKIVRVVDMAYRSGRELKFVITTPTRAASTAERFVPKHVQENEYVTLVTRCRRERYLQIAARAHVSLVMSLREGFPVGFWEQLYLGVIVLFPNRPWARSQLPEWYPFIYDVDENEELNAYAMLCEVLDDYPAAVEKVQFDRLRAWIRERYASGAVYYALRAAAEDAVSAAPLRSRSGAEKLLEEVLEDLSPPFTLEDVRERMAALGRAMPENPDMPLMCVFPSNYDIYRALLVRGYVATRFEGKVPVFEEVK